MMDGPIRNDPPHVPDDDLVLHFYDELTPDRKGAIAAHLEACPRCRTEYASLQRDLGVLDDAVLAADDLPPSFERIVWARLEPSLGKPGRGWITWLLSSPAPLALAALVVLLVVGAFLAGRALSPAPGTDPSAVATDQFRDGILLADLGEHLDRSQMVLVELVSGGDEDAVDFAAERTRVEELMADNRLYRLSAEQAGNSAVSDLLDDIERVLTDIAASPDGLHAEDLADVRRRIESRDLLFKVRVVSSEVRERQREAILRRVGQSS